MQNVSSHWNMDHFEFNFLLRGQLKSLSLNKFFLPLIKVLPCYGDFLVTLFLPLLLEFSGEIILKVFILVLRFAVLVLLKDFVLKKK